ncbi:Hypothetical predicted protein [Scomber scombrus]|uniref:Uncharacterized protein n=1 Tax=Scomber scombrus TaxID=13677 RepID=A0AAV1PV49_SCOSC
MSFWEEHLRFRGRQYDYLEDIPEEDENEDRWSTFSEGSSSEEEEDASASGSKKRGREEGCVEMSPVKRRRRNCHDDEGYSTGSEDEDSPEQRPAFTSGRVSKKRSRQDSCERSPAKRRRGGCDDDDDDDEGWSTFSEDEEEEDSRKRKRDDDDYDGEEEENARRYDLGPPTADVYSLERPLFLSYTLFYLLQLVNMKQQPPYVDYLYPVQTEPELPDQLEEDDDDDDEGWSTVSEDSSSVEEEDEDSWEETNPAKRLWQEREL